MLVQGGDLEYFKRHLKEYFNADYSLTKAVRIEFTDPGDGNKWPNVHMTLTKDTKPELKVRFRRDHFQAEIYDKDDNLLYGSKQ